MHSLDLTDRFSTAAAYPEMVDLPDKSVKTFIYHSTDNPIDYPDPYRSSTKEVREKYHCENPHHDFDKLFKNKIVHQLMPYMSAAWIRGSSTIVKISLRAILGCWAEILLINFSVQIISLERTGLVGESPQKIPLFLTSCFITMKQMKGQTRVGM